MPIMVIYGPNGVSREAYAPYEAELATRETPKEALLHLVGTGGDSVVMDVWESRAAFEAYTEQTINPMLTRHGLPIVPPQVFELEHVIAGPQLAARLGAVPEPA